MKKIFVLKTGSTFPHLSQQLGDFEDWFLDGMGLVLPDVCVADVTRKNALPDYDGIRGVVITGSHAMVTEHHEWSERLAIWLPGLLERKIPVLGVCYGHQLLAYALGGEVGYNPAGKHFGTVEITLNGEGQRDALIGGWGPILGVQVCHNQSVLSLPPGAVRLGGCARDPNQAFRVGSNAWGVQFHPEMRAEMVKSYISTFRQDLTVDGQDPDLLLEACRDTLFGGEILKRFVAITKENQA